MQLKLKFFMTLALLFTTMTAGAYNLTLDPNYSGAPSGIVIPVEYDVFTSTYHYTLTDAQTPSRAGHTFYGWSTSQYGPAQYATGSDHQTNKTITLTGDLTLYAIWEDTGIFTIGSLNYKITKYTPHEVMLTGYDGDKPSGDLAIPASVTPSGDAFAVTSIGKDAFRYCDGLISVTIPASVTSIGLFAFSGCDGLISVTIPASVTTIGDDAFLGCSNLESVTIPASVTSIGSSAFGDCSNLTTVTLNSNPFIGGLAFPAWATVRLNLTANTAEWAKWMTFYNEDYNFQADANTQVFKAELSGTTITLHEVTDKIVTKNTAVVLKSTDNPVMTMTMTESNDTQANSLLGVDDEAGKTAPNPSTMFVLNNGSAGVGFYKLASGKKLGLGKAYLQTASGSNFFGMDEETTSISEERRVKSEKLNSFFDLSGRKVTNPKKGIFIHNGRKEVIR